MAAKNNNNLFFTCSLIEYMGRLEKQPRSRIVDYLDRKNIKQIYKYADVFHCEPIEKVAAEFIERCEISEGDFDNVSACKYAVPNYWDIGEVYERLIEDIYDDAEIETGIWEIYHSWIDRHISDFNTDFYYQSREYIAACYQAGEIL